MKLEYRKLSTDEIKTEMPTGWDLVGEQIVRVIDFATYQAGLDMAHKIGVVADALDHHPDILINYCKVTVKMNTHDVDGISPYDLELARQINALLVD
jgi:4a-hydroxytetrahydrobiopterin dehydratase